jgi:hypothetical protein
MSSIYQIVKENLKDPDNKVLLVDSHSEVVEYETFKEAEELCCLFNANANDSRYYIKEIKS